MKRIILALAILALAFPAFAQDDNPLTALTDPLAEAILNLNERLVNADRRADEIQSLAVNQGGAITSAFELIDNLDARIDALTSLAHGLSRAIDDLYRLADEAAAGPDVPAEE